MDEPAGAVFLSYASEDAEVALRICEALRTAGVEVWFDQSELRGGDAWDTSIRKKIKTCSLFVPVISATTNARNEGYFRLEWKLAVDRSHLIADDQPFLLPVVIDQSAETTARVPDRFRERQWSRLSDEKSIESFAERVRFMLSRGDGPVTQPVKPIARQEQAHAASHAHPSAEGIAGASAGPGTKRRTWLVTASGLLVLAAAVLGYQQFRPASRQIESIAVMPFVNASGNAEFEYLSDGMTETLIGSLSQLPMLNVKARSAVFTYKDRNVTPGVIGRELKVQGVLNGRVAQHGEDLSLYVELIDIGLDKVVWSEQYNRKQADLVSLVTESPRPHALIATGGS